jgi:hypothetical protein
MKKLLIVAALGGLLAACEQPVPVLPIEDNIGGTLPTKEPKGVIFTDPKTGKDTFIPEDGKGIFF